LSMPGGNGRDSRRPAPLGGDQVEGHHAVHQLLVGRRHVRRLWVAQAQAATSPLDQIVELARRRGTPVHLKNADALQAAAHTGAPQGVIAWADPVMAVPLDELLASTGAQAPAFLVVLDGVTDPGNFGALLRSAACAGVGGVVIGRHRSAALTAAALKAAAGAAEVLPIAQVPGIPGAIAQLTRAGIWTVGLDPVVKDDLWRTPLLDGPVALVLGSEGNGLSQLARQRCDALIRVPQAGPLGSLNVAAAGAVACFEVARRRSVAR
jgi:23S rRNA (guanosine2251-2'-O)-methyltransferase